MTAKALPSFFAALAILHLAACSAPDRGSDSAFDPVPAAAEPVPVDIEMTLNELAGSYRDAGEGAPVMLIVPGSGPTDRDGNNPQGVSAASYRLLAQGLADAGISTLRVDKRGMFGSSAAGDGNAVTVELYARDYIDWAAHLREQTGQPCVFLLGHSEGGPMVAAAAAQDASGICGLVMMSSPGRKMGDILREQLSANPANAPLLPDADRAIAALEAGERIDVSSMHPALQTIFPPVIQGFLISSFAVDPARLIQIADLPTLVIQGDNDFQVGVTDARRLEAAGGTLVLLPGVNHVLKDAPKGRAANAATYADPDRPLADGIVPAIKTFVEQHSP